MRTLQLGLVILSAIVISACSSTDDTTQAAPTPTQEVGGVATYQTLSIDELAAAMENEDREYTVVNVHIPYQGEIDGTDYNIAYNDLDALTTALPNKSAPIILYCRSGNMSEQASRALVERGYTQVYDVPGGMVAWQSSGRTLVDK